MVMRKIVIVVPSVKNNYFKVSFGGNPAKRKNPVLVFNWAKRKILLATQKGEKTAVMIKDRGTVINESLTSGNSNYLLWLALAFLEDYLPLNFYREKEKLYVGSEA